FHLRPTGTATFAILDFQLPIANSGNREFEFHNSSELLAACTTRRFQSRRCASAIRIVRPRQSRAETQPKLQRAFAFGNVSSCNFCNVLTFVVVAGPGPAAVEVVEQMISLIHRHPS